MNGAFQGSVKVIDETGAVYAWILVPHSHGQSTIEFELRETGTTIVAAAESFATSNIAFVFEVQSAISNQIIVDSEQLSDNVSIVGVEDDLLEDKYGVFTGLGRRNDQSFDQYRAQTACLWSAFSHAGTEKGMIDSLQCLLGDVTLTVTESRDVIGNRVFLIPQYGDDDPDPYNPADPINLVRTDGDNPHYYIADIPSDFRTSYPATEDPLSIILLGVVAARPEIDNNPEVWDNVSADKIRSFTIRTPQAIGNEVFISVDEADAMVLITEELVSRRTGVLVDPMANTFIATTVTVTEATINSVLEVLPINLPVEGVDFTVDVLKGEITWNGAWPAFKTPDDGTIYKITYSFRLDDAIRTIVRQMKPVQRSVIIEFTNQTSSLPPVIET
jgi:hypothetical protein